MAATATSSAAGGTIASTITAASRSFRRLVKRAGVEAIADAAHSENQFGIGVVAFDVLTQAADVNIDGPRLHEGVASPYHVEQLLARVEPHRVLHEEAQQLELAQRQRPALAVDPHLVGVEVDAQAAALVEAVAGRLDGLPRAAQQRAHARHQLARRERLDHVVVGAHLEPDHAIDLGAARRDDQDRQAGELGVGPHLAADLEPRHPGQHQVEHDQVGRAAADTGERRSAVAFFFDREALAFEVVADELPDLALVLDHEDAMVDGSAALLLLRLIHRSSPAFRYSCLRSMCLMFLPSTMKTTISAI